MKIIKSDETEYDDLKEIENKMKSEYYKTKKLIYKEMEDFFFMSVLKCDRTFTQLTIDDKMIIFRNKIDTIFYQYLDKVIFDNRMKLFKIINDDYNCRFNEYEINNFERDVCEFKTAISNLIYKILKALRKTYMYDYTKSYVGKYKRLENYNLIMVMINDLIDNFNRFSIKYKNCGKVIMLSGRKSSKIERRKLRKFKTKMMNKTMNFLEIFNLYKAWRKNILKQFNAYNLISRNDEYFKHLFNLKYANFKNKIYIFR